MFFRQRLRILTKTILQSLWCSFMRPAFLSALLIPALASVAMLFSGGSGDVIGSVPDPVMIQVDGDCECCGDTCQCCENCGCGCGVSSPSDISVEEDLTSHIGKVVQRKTREGLWEVTDAWRDESGELMYLYRQVSPVSSGNCPGGVCPQPMSTGYYDGTSQWTYPNDIASHLSGSSHGISASELSGMTKDEMEAMHDYLHNTASGVSSVQTSSSCPGGVCPQPSRRPAWRWRR